MERPSWSVDEGINRVLTFRKDADTLPRFLAAAVPHHVPAVVAALAKLSHARYPNICS